MKFIHIQGTWEHFLPLEELSRQRGMITTASYSQVTEGLYRRAAGRWERYRKYLEPVLPILAPWAERHGYSF